MIMAAAGSWMDSVQVENFERVAAKPSHSGVFAAINLGSTLLAERLFFLNS